jgi:hypothetical protein
VQPGGRILDARTSAHRNDFDCGTSRIAANVMVNLVDESRVECNRLPDLTSRMRSSGDDEEACWIAGIHREVAPESSCRPCKASSVATTCILPCTCRQSTRFSHARPRSFASTKALWRSQLRAARHGHRHARPDRHVCNRDVWLDFESRTDVYAVSPTTDARSEYAGPTVEIRGRSL